MNRIIITLLAIIVVISAMCTAFMLVTPKRVEEKANIETKISEEEILDDCTDEYEEMEYESTVKANTEEEKTSPNCSITTKTFFLGCNHTKSEYANLPEKMVNLTKDELQEEYRRL